MILLSASDASLSDDSLLYETGEEIDPVETEGKDPDSASTEKTFSCQASLKNGGFLETEQVFQILSTPTSKCLPAIPVGRKEKVAKSLRMKGVRHGEQMGIKEKFQMTMEHGLVLED